MILLRQESLERKFVSPNSFAQIMTCVFQNSCKALSFALSYITEHKEIKDKCLEEIQNVCLSNGQLDISTENLRKLTYLEACIKETLRLRTRLDIVYMI